MNEAMRPAGEKSSRATAFAPPPAARESYQKARHIFLSGILADYDEARHLCDQTLSAYPDHTKALQLLGMMDLAEGKLQMAEVHLTKAIELKVSLG